MKKRITIGVVGPKQTRLGEAHHRAILTDDEVELIREIYDEGLLSYAKIATAFGVSKSTVSEIVKYNRRASTPDSYKTIEIEIKNDKIIYYREVKN